MATITTLKSGDYTDTTVWSTGTVPVDGDKVTISKLGTATSRTTSSAISAGSGNVPVTAGTGTGLIGEVIEFDSRPGEYYELTTGFTASAGTAVVTPVLAGAIASGATLRNRGHKVKLLGTRIAGDDTTTGFTVNGVLYWDRVANSSLQVKGNYIVNALGTEDRGTAVDPLTAVSATLLLNYSAVMAMQKYGATYAAGGRCKHYGATRTRKTTTTSALSAAVTTFTVVDATGWADGDSLMIFPTAQGAASTVLEQRTIAAGGVSGNTITITAGITNSKLTGAYVVNRTSNVRTVDANPSFGFGQITWAAGASGLLDDKNIVNSEWFSGANTGFINAFVPQASAAAGQPRQFIATGSIFRSSAIGGLAVGSANFVSSGITPGFIGGCVLTSDSSGFALQGVGHVFDSCVITSIGTLNSGAAAYGVVANNNTNPTPIKTGPISNSLVYAFNGNSQGVAFLANPGDPSSGNTYMQGRSSSTFTAQLICPGAVLAGHDFAPFGMTSTSSLFANINAGTLALVNCKYGTSNSPFTYGAVPGVRISSSYGDYFGGAQDVHEIWDNEGYARADTSTRNRGDAALNVTNRTTSPFTYSFTQAVANGATKRLVGYLRRNAAW
jgi:hypothetical protein